MRNYHAEYDINRTYSRIKDMKRNKKERDDSDFYSAMVTTVMIIGICATIIAAIIFGN